MDAVSGGWETTGRRRRRKRQQRSYPVTKKRSKHGVGTSFFCEANTLYTVAHFFDHRLVALSEGGKRRSLVWTVRNCCDGAFRANDVFPLFKMLVAVLFFKPFSFFIFQIFYKSFNHFFFRLFYFVAHFFLNGLRTTVLHDLSLPY